MTNVNCRFYDTLPFSSPGDGEQNQKHTQQYLLWKNQRHSQRPEVNDPTWEPRQAGSTQKRPCSGLVATTPSPVRALCVWEWIRRQRHSGRFRQLSCNIPPPNPTLLPPLLSLYLCLWSVWMRVELHVMLGRVKRVHGNYGYKPPFEE